MTQGPVTVASLFVPEERNGPDLPRPPLPLEVGPTHFSICRFAPGLRSTLASARTATAVKARDVLSRADARSHASEESGGEFLGRQIGYPTQWRPLLVHRVIRSNAAFRRFRAEAEIAPNVLVYRLIPYPCTFVGKKGSYAGTKLRYSFARRALSIVRGLCE